MAPAHPPFRGDVSALPWAERKIYFTYPSGKEAVCGINPPGSFLGEE